MKKKQHQAWGLGSLFGIPLADGSKMLGQVLGVEPMVLNSVACALFDQRADGGAPIVDNLVAVMLTTRDLLDNSVWEVIGSAAVEVPKVHFPYESLRSESFVGAEVIGSRNVGEFANAFFGLSPWDDWADPEYLDKLLISKDKKPKKLLYKSQTH